MNRGSGAPRVLYVEDEPVLHRAVGRALAAVGMDVTCAEVGSEALELARALAPDLLLVDCTLPDCNGLELAGQLTELTGAPVIMVSGRPRPDGIQLPWLRKPFTRGSLQGVALEHLAARK